MKHIITAFCAGLFLLRSAVGAQPDDANLKKACLSATVQAIEIDIQRNQAWLKQMTDPKKKAEYEKELVRLAEEERKYRSMPPADYELPKKLSLTGQYEGQILFDEQSRSGPFYHMVASAAPLTRGKRYSFEVYLLYRRAYPFPDYYVYVSKSEKKDF